MHVDLLNYEHIFSSVLIYLKYSIYLKRRNVEEGGVFIGVGSGFSLR
jgi:hypothetical protein